MKTSEDVASEEAVEYSSQEVEVLLEKRFGKARPPSVKVCNLCSPASLDKCKSCMFNTPAASKNNFRPAHPPGVMENYISSIVP